MADELHTFRLPLGWSRHLTLGVKVGGPGRLGRDRERTGEPDGTSPPASPGSLPRALSSCTTTTNGGLRPPSAALPGPALGGIFRRAFRDHLLNAAPCVLLLTLDSAGARTASLAELRPRHRLAAVPDGRQRAKPPAQGTRPSVPRPLPPFDQGMRGSRAN